MFNKVRRNFIITSFLSLFGVLFLILGGINLSSYISLAHSSSNIVNRILDGDGKIDHYGDMPPEFPFQTRYFYVKLDSEGEITYTDLVHIAAIDLDEADIMATNVYNSNSYSGFYDRYRYGRKDTEEGSLIVFVDMADALDDYYGFMKASIAFGLGGLTFVCLLIIFFATRVLKPVKEAYEKQSRFITEASHELKTPLTIISANTEIIELNEGKSEWTSSIHEQVNRLADLTNKLVYLSKMDEGAPLLHVEFNVSLALEECISSFHALLEKKGQEVKTEIEENVLIDANEEMIRQLFTLLLDNALKYADKKEINIGLKDEGRYITIEFSNHHTGLKDGSLDYLFERFRRDDDSHNQATGGHGIGLSLAKAIVENHKGKIKASSKEEIITFYITFPKK